MPSVCNSTLLKASIPLQQTLATQPGPMIKDSPFNFKSSFVRQPARGLKIPPTASHNFLYLNIHKVQQCTYLSSPFNFHINFFKLSQYNRSRSRNKLDIYYCRGKKKKRKRLAPSRRKQRGQQRRGKEHKRTENKPILRVEPIKSGVWAKSSRSKA